ncbi:Diacylglycerol O-acyltransferase 2B (Diglyceride acyltransferase 2B) (MrDGAT2B) [Durusdinium trenchii]|uniref:diacylglycerol O-acyltransferase n=1 Tax=Durusdinium trenchii TaxID=1381693 RepID=A0ABP0QVD3_9DINO
MPPANQKWPEHGAGAQVETRVAEKLTSDPQLTSGKLLAGGPRVLIESGSTGREPSVEYSSGVNGIAAVLMYMLLGLIWGWCDLLGRPIYPLAAYIALLISPLRLGWSNSERCEVRSVISIYFFIFSAAVLPVWCLKRGGTWGRSLFAIYVSWYMFWDTAHLRGGRFMPTFRRRNFWKHFAAYFPMSLTRTAKLDPKRNYIFGYHPHGVSWLVISMGACCNFATEATGFSELFPGIDLRIPVFREYLLGLGVNSVSKDSIDQNLKRCPGSSVMIVIGGAQPGTVDVGRGTDVRWFVSEKETEEQRIAFSQGFMLSIRPLSTWPLLNGVMGEVKGENEKGPCCSPSLADQRPMFVLPLGGESKDVLRSGRTVGHVRHDVLDVELKKRSKRARRNSNSSQAEGDRWWTRTGTVMCPLTHFPIRLLPYPPFKLRSEAPKSSPHILIDGKYLAMQLIVNGKAPAGIREMTDQDIIALDGYMQRCKLCPWRPRMAQNLAREMMSAPTQELRTEAAQELRAIRSKTRAELKKLSAIQDNRLAKLLVISETPGLEMVDQNASLEGNLIRIRL